MRSIPSEFRRLALPTILPGILAACSATTDPMSLRETRDGNLLTYTTGAATRAISIRHEDGRHYVCAEPQPDASLDETQDSNVSISLINFGTDGGGDNASVGEGSLGGRSANVLITREIMYRFCEFVGNTAITDAQKLALFNTVLTTVTNINQTDHGTGTAGASSASVGATQTITSGSTQTLTDTGQTGSATSSSGTSSSDLTDTVE